MPKAGKIKAVVSMAMVLAVGSAIAAAPVKWVPYKSDALGVELSVPSDWQKTENPKAFAFHYDDPAGGSAAIGILKSTQITKIEDAADQDFKTPGRPMDWIHSNARVNDMRAIKITGTDAKDPQKRFVRYFVETPNGVYLVQCMGTAEHWSTFSPLFATMLTKLKFS